MVTTLEERNEGNESVERTPSQEIPVQSAVIRSYSRSEDAKAAVRFLGEQGFPLEQVSISARGLVRSAPDAARLDLWKVLASGACGGLVTGALVGQMLGLFVVNPMGWLTLLIATSSLGATLGALLDFGLSWSRGDKNDAESTKSRSADRYEVVVAQHRAQEAKTILSDYVRLTS